MRAPHGASAGPDNASSSMRDPHASCVSYRNECSAYWRSGAALRPAVLVLRACAAAEAEHPVHSRRQHRLRRHRRLRRRGAARRADAAHRSARRRRSAADAVPGRAGLHAVARRVDDRALFHPLRTVAGCRRGDGHLAAGDGNHHGRDAARRRLCHGDLRQMASRRAALQPAAEQGLRRVLRHPARRHLGRLPA